MATLGEDPKRLGIFFFFDAQGVVDSYVEALLADMVKNLSELVIVVNGEVTAKSYAKLSAFTDNIILRENKGLDAWAYKTALESYGWDRLVEFDEVVLFNATIMGPVYPFEEMFTEMAGRDIDFWGITWFHKVPYDPFGHAAEGYLPRHLQSHFHAYRRSLVSSKAFQDYWDNLPQMSSYEDSVGLHEAPFTQRFERLGFTSDVYVNTEDLEGYTFSPVLFAPKRLIEEKRCPIFKRRSFFHDYQDLVRQSVGNTSLDLYEYLRDHTDFDTNLIWDNVLRSMNMEDLVKNLHLTYVLPTQAVIREPKPQKVALIAHLYYMDLLEPTLAYVKSMPEGTDLILTVGSQEKAELVEEACKDLPYNVTVRLIENRGRDVSALRVGCKDIIHDYDLVCFTHDKKVTQVRPYSVGDGFAIKCFENLLATRDFVKNVIATFDAEPRLGLLAPTPPNHGDYFPLFSMGWGPNFERTKTLLEKEREDEGPGRTDMRRPPVGNEGEVERCQQPGDPEHRVDVEEALPVEAFEVDGPPVGERQGRPGDDEEQGDAQGPHRDAEGLAGQDISPTVFVEMNVEVGQNDEQRGQSPDEVEIEDPGFPGRPPARCRRTRHCQLPIPRARWKALRSGLCRGRGIQRSAFFLRRFSSTPRRKRLLTMSSS